MNKYRIFFLLTLLEAATLGLLLFFGQARVAARTEGELKPMRALVDTLQLTDLALWTEARYTRHPSQADRFTPFQDFPSSLDHFPAGSIMAPPRQGSSQP